MTKKIAVINDLSGFGRCSLTAAISVITAMGVQACPLPTAILTAQTGYSSYYLDDYTEKMEYYRSEWAKMNQKFDGIYTGFVSSEAQIQQIFRFIDTFYTSDTFLLADPVMGDNGEKFSFFTPGLLEQMKLLAKRADIITPNLTELCLLTDADLQYVNNLTDAETLTKTASELARSFCEDGPAHIIVTGISFTDSEEVRQIGNLYVTKDTISFCAFPYIGESYSGTGDLFASCITAGIARGDSIPELMRLAGSFLEQALIDSVREYVPRNDGVNYEKYLSMLMPAKQTEAIKLSKTGI